MRRWTAIITTTLALGLLGACGDDTTSDDPKSSDAPASAGGDTCAELEALGYTGADFGPVAVWEGPDAVRARVESLLEIKDVAAPEEVADAWQTRIDYLDRLAATFTAEGPDLPSPADLLETDAEKAADGALTDWWFSTCA